MSEKVEGMIDDCSIELDYLLKINLFTKEEIRDVHTHRRDHLYRIQKKATERTEYLLYLEYEMDLLTKIEERRVLAKNREFMTEIDYRLKERMRKLYERLLKSFPRDHFLWMSFFRFCRRVKYWVIGSNHMGLMLRCIGEERPDMYVFAAKWEIEANNNERARPWLLDGQTFSGELCRGRWLEPYVFKPIYGAGARGLLIPLMMITAMRTETYGSNHLPRHNTPENLNIIESSQHPANPEIRTALIELELKNCQSTMKEIVNQKEEKMQRTRVEDRMKKERKDTLRGRCAMLAYENAKKVVSDFDFYTNMYDILASYPAATSLRRMVLEDLVTMFSDKEVSWDLRARACVDTFDVEAPEIDLEAGSEVKKLSYGERIRKATEVYEEAVIKIPTPEMWRLYINFTFEMSEKGGGKRGFIKKAMEDGMKEGLVSTKHYLMYTELLLKLGGRTNRAFSVLSDGVSKHPECPQLWFEFVRFHLSRQFEEPGMRHFREANNNLMKVPAAEIMPIWNMAIQYMLTTTPNSVEALFLEGIKLRSDLAAFLKPKYYNWKVHNDGIGSARNMANDTFCTPPNLELWKEIIKLELVQPELCVKSIRACYESITKHFKDDASIWIEYIAFELKFGDVTFVSSVHSRALENLSLHESAIFIQRYNSREITSLTQELPREP